MIRRTKYLFAIVFAGLCVGLCGCGTAKVLGRHEIGTAPKPTMIYSVHVALTCAYVNGVGIRWVDSNGSDHFKIRQRISDG